MTTAQGGRPSKGDRVLVKTYTNPAAKTGLESLRKKYGYKQLSPFLETLYEAVLDGRIDLDAVMPQGLLPISALPAAAASKEVRRSA
ncbi:hypothetical protein [Tsukamurella ocularis]|uniref:hypothetical protein n=1 Tax=Tsukamurella ocularis TaxID=1970234 RepID=UPI0021688F5B|nr:hypothetical protein [Tsukamurella ocularis]MCS3853304.1 hypothetical protein [Tsukamurella ocularis]